jgi:hypothetical protein
MATTTNYGWTTPDDTALVKDGAAAIRTLGSSVDTTTKNLNPSTTLGDIEYRSSTANTNTRLGIGTTGQVLSVVGGVPAWATAGSGLTFITSATAANTSQTLSVNNCFSSAYVNYLILSDLETATGNENFTFKLRVSGTDSSTGYHYAGFWIGSTVASLNAVAGASQTSFSLRDIGPEKGLHTLDISNPFAAIDTTILTKGIQSYTGSNVEAAVILGSHDVDTSYDGFSLISGTSNLTGTVRVYGYSNS